ncbi:MAG: hypothetical protein ACKO2G_08655 [Verrucomicrobiales bacterium]
MNAPTTTLSQRQKSAGADHHLWNNNGTWWFHATAHLADNTARRIRLSLRTTDLAEARRRRDNILSRHSPTL